MIRLLFGLFISVVISRWLYSEVALSLPQAVPLIDYALEAVSIPTHDKWRVEPVKDALGLLGVGSDDVMVKEAETKRTAMRQRRALRDIL